MSMLEEMIQYVKAVLSFRDYRDISTAPAWRSRPTRMKHSRTPFSSSRVRPVSQGHQVLKCFSTARERNDYFHELRARGVKHVNKFSESVGYGKNLWFVVHP